MLRYQIIHWIASDSIPNIAILYRDWKSNLIVLIFQGKKQGSYRYPLGTTAVLKQRVIPLEVESVAIHQVQAMEVEPTSSR